MRTVVGDEPVEAFRTQLVLGESGISDIEFIQVGDETLDAEMDRVIEQVPVERGIIFPFGELTEFTAHEEGLLARPGPLQGQQAAEIRGLRGVVAAAHLANQRALAVDDLVM